MHIGPYREPHINNYPLLVSPTEMEKDENRTVSRKSISNIRNFSTKSSEQNTHQDIPWTMLFTMFPFLYVPK